MNKINYKLAIYLFFFFAAGLFSVLPVALYFYDPLQLFHAAWGRSPTFDKDMRQQVAGIVRNYDFDSIILGTSMLENSSAAEAGRVLGGEFVNISMSSSLHYERSLVLSYVLGKKSLRNVVYSLDYTYLSPGYDHPNYPKETWSYLYDNNRLNDFKAYYNDKYFLCLLRWSVDPRCVGKAKSLDRPNAWFMHPDHASRFGGLDKWLSAVNNGQIKSAFKTIADSAKRVGVPVLVDESRYLSRKSEILAYVDDHVLAHARGNPKTNFYYVFPPYSRIHFSILYQTQPERARLHEDVVQYIVSQSKNMHNVRVLGYEDQDFLDDISNYKDPRHYHEKFNRMFLEDMRVGRHVLNQENIAGYLSVAKGKALAFDLSGLGAKIEAYLKSSTEKGAGR
ncbi:hypothetical protein [Aquipseudomonas guryensis]|jgi:hypothetical protein|uniref:Uncharacterized protein n=1 Tax=Aquipseudomonas guryensis TaxID=2759165 RepID=A0A7W4DAC6_9GAMM|nr:hypothetical protein [Pseudomonas guryensis]MBB1518929.1 hypothetical protein [Pseudomonas guryensis]